MTTVAILGIGSRLERQNDASPPVFQEVPEVRGIPLSERNDLVEVTHLGSTAKDYIYGLSDGQETTFAINWDQTNAVHQGLETDQLNKTAPQFRVVVTNQDSPETGYTYTFTGLVLSIERNLQPNEARTLNVTIKPSGAIVKAAIS